MDLSLLEEKRTTSPTLALPVPVLLPSATRLGNQTTRPSGP